MAFSSVVEAGLLNAGVELIDEKRRYRAIVRVDGSISLGAIVGSIHKMGALAQGLPACNGWTFWHFERGGKLVCIDDLRTIMRAQMKDSD